MAEHMVGSTILRIAGEVRALTARGRRICNLTIGDFDPRQFPIPAMLRDGIEAALRDGQTTYPPYVGTPVLREAIRTFTRDGLGLDYPVESVLVTSGARPAIYGAFRGLVDPGDRVVYSVPCWQYMYYCGLVGAEGVPVMTDAATGFLPTRRSLESAVRGARMLVLNSPLNPAGTMFEPDTLADICDLVLEENARRAGQERPLYLLYDQVYWMLTYGDVPHVSPVGLRPEMRPYTLLVDAISKSFASTGLRVGWILGPGDLIKAIGEFLADVGTWAPRPEQVATAALLTAPQAIAEYHRGMKEGLRQRLDALHRGLAAMRDRGLPVDVSRPEGAIYISARFALPGRTNEEIRTQLLNEADFAVVPFQAFGVAEDTGWFRLSVGAVSLADIEDVLPKVAAVVERLAAPARQGAS